ncbi:interactor protein for cytohesin exchange factors 1 [Pungitius pungitius]|uniref:interactor protein for cytohesin exchange factors 1 n=1 Tax=Pungitius pungitius TaxID=134920 RepID=UPI002E0D5C94
MSRRGVSIRDLGPLDCQGWLLRRKEGRRFLGSRWVRYWFVLKKSSLYWYSSKTAQKAEGFILLSGFTVGQATPRSRKRHVIMASHPLIVTIFIAAESFIEMNKWISKLSEAADPCDETNVEGCYSEGSDQDADEPSCASSSVNSECREDDSEDGDSTASGDHRRRSGSEGGSRRRDEAPPRLDVPEPDGAAGGLPPPLPPPLLHVSEDETQEEVVVHEKPPDEMESLYNHLRAASLSPIGQSSGRDFRASFITRCQDDRVNEQLHLLRILSSTLKAKELELLEVEQVERILAEPKLAAPEYRKWRRSNGSLLQEIAQRAAGGGGC